MTPANSLRPKPLDWQTLELELMGSRDSGPCECCNNMSRVVWGRMTDAEGPLAAYYVQWTLNAPKHAANFEVIVGQWGEGTSPKDRQVVALTYRVHAGQSGFMVINAETRPVNFKTLAETTLRRDQVIGTPLAHDIFAIADAIFMRDERIEEIRGWSHGSVG